MVHHELVPALRGVQPHPDTALGRGGDRQHQRLVGHEIGADQIQLTLGQIDQADEHPQVRFGAEARARGHQLHRGHRAVLVRGGGLVVAVADELLGLLEPVEREHLGELGDDRPGHLDVEIQPVQVPAAILRLQIGRVDHVHRPHERHLVVDDQQLAVIAQIGPAPLAAQRVQRHHRVPLDAGGGQPGLQLLVLRVALAAELVEQHPDRHPTGGRIGECGAEAVGHRIPGHDVELRVHGVLGGLDGRGHLVEGDVGGQHPAAVAGDHRERGELPVAAGDRGHPRRCGETGRVVRVRFEPAGERPGGVRLDLAPFPAQIGTADQQVQRQPDDRYQQDDQQPGRGRGGGAVLRHGADRDDLDPVVDDHHHDRPDLGPVDAVPIHASALHQDDDQGDQREQPDAAAEQQHRPDRWLQGVVTDAVHAAAVPDPMGE